MIADPVKSAIVILAWLLALSVALSAMYLAIRALLFLIQLAHEALGL
jgi:hypothetical protein